MFLFQIYDLDLVVGHREGYPVSFSYIPLKDTEDAGKPLFQEPDETKC